MVKPKVLSYNNLPTRLPIMFTAVVWLLLDRLKLEGPAVGAVWTFVGLYWILCIIAVCVEDKTNIFKGGWRG